MALDIMKERGVPLERQVFTWKEMAGPPVSKLDSDAFTRVRIILMNGIEMEQNRFLHAFARSNRDLRAYIAAIRRIEHHQQTLVNWLLPPDETPLETTIGYEQVAIEVTAAIAQQEPDAYLAQVYRFGLLEDFDHLYRFSALLDRVEGKDANTILQSYTDILPGRPTSLEHRAPADDVRLPYDRTAGALISKLNALTILSGENQVRDFYMNIGPLYPDPIGRGLYAEIASIEEQHVTQYESIIDPDETWLEKWVLHEANEVYNYWSCVEAEKDARVKAIFERFLDYELGHLHYVMDMMKGMERRDPAELLSASLGKAIPYASQRDFVRQVLANEQDFRANGTDIGLVAESDATRNYRTQLNADGAFSDLISVDYRWRPGTELTQVPTQQHAA